MASSPRPSGRWEERPGRFPWEGPGFPSSVSPLLGRPGNCSSPPPPGTCPGLLTPGPPLPGSPLPGSGGGGHQEVTPSRDAGRLSQASSATWWPQASRHLCPTGASSPSVGGAGPHQGCSENPGPVPEPRPGMRPSLCPARCVQAPGEARREGLTQRGAPERGRLSPRVRVSVCMHVCVCVHVCAYVHACACALGAEGLRGGLLHGKVSQAGKE